VDRDDHRELGEGPDGAAGEAAGAVGGSTESGADGVETRLTDGVLHVPSSRKKSPRQVTLLVGVLFLSFVVSHHPRDEGQQHYPSRPVTRLEGNVAGLVAILGGRRSLAAVLGLAIAFTIP